MQTRIVSYGGLYISGGPPAPNFRRVAGRRDSPMTASSGGHPRRIPSETCTGKIRNPPSLADKNAKCRLGNARTLERAGHVAAAESSRGLIPFPENRLQNALRLKHKIARAVRARSVCAPLSGELHLPRPTRLTLCRESLDRSSFA